MTQNERLLQVLRRGPATNREIHQQAGPMIVNSRIAELRARGYRIECEYVGGKGASAYRYSLLSEPTSFRATRENVVAEAEVHDVGSLSSDRFDGGLARGRTRLPLPSIVPAVPTPAAGTQLSIEVAA